MRLVDIDRVPVADELQEFANPCVVQLPRWAIEEIVRTCSAFPNIFPCVEGRGGNGKRRQRMTKMCCYCDLCGKEMPLSSDTMYKYKLRKAILGGWKYIEAHTECVNKLCDTAEERRTKKEADKIRQMSDEELAKWITEYVLNLQNNGSLKIAKKAWLDWLKQEVENE